jgi:hypothetical protein
MTLSSHDDPGAPPHGTQRASAGSIRTALENAIVTPTAR